MLIEIKMPQMGESIFEGTITRWLKKPGDAIEKDEPLFEISTDKVDAEIPSPVSGIVRETRFPEGATVQVNSVVAVIGDVSEAAGAPSVAASPELQAAAELQPGAESATRTPAGEETPAQTKDAPTRAEEEGARHVRYSPLVRRMAKDNNIDLDQLGGTGPERRVTKEDVLRYLEQREAAAARPTVSAVPETPAPETRAPARKAVSVPAAPPATSAPPAAPVPGELVPLTKMRAIIAQRMAQ